MDVFQITDQKSAVIFDLSAIHLQSGHIEKIPRYLGAFKKFMETGKIAKAILKIPPEAKLKENNLNMEIQNIPIENIISELAADRSISNFIIFGQISQIVPICTQTRLQNVVIVTDEDIHPFINNNLTRKYHILPGRVIYFLNNAFWWRVTPVEKIHPEDINKNILPDKSINEIGLLSQYAVNLPKDASGIQERDKIFQQIEALAPEHLGYKNGQIACYTEDLKSNTITDAEKELLSSNIVNIMADLDAIFLRFPAIGDNNPEVLDALMKFQTLRGMIVLLTLGQKHNKNLDILCKENRKKKGKVPQRFNLQTFSLGGTNLTNNATELKTFFQENITFGATVISNHLNQMEKTVVKPQYTAEKLSESSNPFIQQSNSNSPTFINSEEKTNIQNETRISKSKNPFA